MKTYVAQQNDRLDSIYCKFYECKNISQKDYEAPFAKFVLANAHLLNCAVLKGGEIVNLPKLDSEKNSNEIKGIW